MGGKFVISLDFELHWGGAEKYKMPELHGYFMDTRASIPRVLQLFEENKIRATWATVGFLFARNKEELLQFFPIEKPLYSNEKLSTYIYFDQVGANETEDPFHFAPSLIEKIIATTGQELASHTFSHYYCNEPGQTKFQFEADLKAAQAISQKNFGIALRSLVFPRNQFNEQYVDLIHEQGFKVIRDNPDVWIWSKNYGKLTSIARAVDTLFSISRPTSFKKAFTSGGIVVLPASRFFRPFKKKEKIIQTLKLSRIKREMSFAAKNRRNYHLWWHPHNFGNNVLVNMEQLNEIIVHFKELEKKYDFKSANMGDFIK